MASVSLGGVSVQESTGNSSYAVKFEVRVKSHGGQTDMSLVNLAGILRQSPWIPRPAMFDLVLNLQIPRLETSSIAVPHMYEDLVTLPLWCQPQYSGSASENVDLIGNETGQVRLTMTDAMPPLFSGYTSPTKASHRVYRENPIDAVCAPDGIPTYLLDSITLHVTQLTPLSASLGRHDSLFDDIDDSDGDLDGQSETDEDLLVSDTWSEYTRALDAVTAALYAFFAVECCPSTSTLEIVHDNDFYPLHKLAPSICNPAAIKNLALHSVFLSPLARIIGGPAHAPSSVENVPQKLWHLLHRRVLADSPVAQIDIAEPPVMGRGRLRDIGDLLGFSVPRAEEHGEDEEDCLLDDEDKMLQALPDAQSSNHDGDMLLLDEEDYMTDADDLFSV